MSRRRIRSWALWLLPLLAVRAFLPVGFMLSFQAGSLELAFCPSQSPGLVATLGEQAAAAHGTLAHHVDHATHHGTHGSNVEPPCAFGMAALAIAVDVPYLANAAARVDDFSVDVPYPFHVGIGPARADRIRGPPLVS
jgi:hypothetical protein